MERGLQDVRDPRGVDLCSGIGHPCARGSSTPPLGGPCQSDIAFARKQQHTTPIHQIMGNQMLLLLGGAVAAGLVARPPTPTHAPRTGSLTGIWWAAPPLPPFRFDLRPLHRGSNTRVALRWVYSCCQSHMRGRVLLSFALLQLLQLLLAARIRSVRRKSHPAEIDIRTAFRVLLCVYGIPTFEDGPKAILADGFAGAFLRGRNGCDGYPPGARIREPGPPTEGSPPALDSGRQLAALSPVQDQGYMVSASEGISKCIPLLSSSESPFFSFFSVVSVFADPFPPPFARTAQA